MSGVSVVFTTTDSIFLAQSQCLLYIPVVSAADAAPVDPPDSENSTDLSDGLLISF